MTDTPEVLHATTVSINARAVLILGKSGSGKSSLALQLIGMGATLVADDRTQVVARGGQVIASAPPPIEGLIEARGVGLLRCAFAGPTPLHLVVDLDREETERLPPDRRRQIAGIALPCLHRVDHAHFAAAILLWLRSGVRSAP
jgi:HPr kinase/phosphorylase